MNYKNQMGGYVGFTDFIYVDGRVGMGSGDLEREYSELMPQCLAKAGGNTSTKAEPDLNGAADDALRDLREHNELN